MNFSSTFLTRIRKGMAHSVVGFLTIIILIDMYHSRYMDQWQFYTAISNTLAFYIHTLILLPFLTTRRKPKKYFIFVIIGFLIFAYAANWVYAVRSSEMILAPDGTHFSPVQIFFEPEWFFGVLAVGFVLFFPMFMVSFAYHLFLISKQERKRIFSGKYIEIITNIIIAFSFFILFITTGRNTGQVFQKIVQFLTFAFVFYFNAFVLIPKLLSKKRFLAYVVSLIILFAGFFFVKPLFNTSVIAFNIEDRYYIIGSIVLFFIAIFISFIYDYIRSNVKARERLFSLQLSSKESELQLLKSQVNPHFLFNTLNTLYATALKEEAPKTAKSIAKLGSLIRYMQSDINKEMIPLQKEVDYLKDYIEIQKLRLAIEPEIITSFENIEEQMMSPGLFIPLVENAFKYGIHPFQKSTIQIKVACNEKSISFLCENDYDPEQKVHYMNEGFGIGIKNVQKRLELVYPEKHTFDIDKSESHFVVRLTLDLI